MKILWLPVVKSFKKCETRIKINVSISDITDNTRKYPYKEIYLSRQNKTLSFLCYLKAIDPQILASKHFFSKNKGKSKLYFKT